LHSGNKAKFGCAANFALLGKPHLAHEGEWNWHALSGEENLESTRLDTLFTREPNTSSKPTRYPARGDTVASKESKYALNLLDLNIIVGLKNSFTIGF